MLIRLYLLCFFLIIIWCQQLVYRHIQNNGNCLKFYICHKPFTRFNTLNSILFQVETLQLQKIGKSALGCFFRHRLTQFPDF